MRDVGTQMPQSEPLAVYDAAMADLMHGLGPVLAALKYGYSPAEAWRFPDPAHVGAVCAALLALDALGDKT